MQAIGFLNWKYQKKNIANLEFPYGVCNKIFFVSFQLFLSALIVSSSSGQRFLPRGSKSLTAQFPFGAHQASAQHSSGGHHGHHHGHHNIHHEDGKFHF